MALLVAGAVALHGVLTGSLQLFIRSLIGSAALVAIQLANTTLCLLIPWFAVGWRAAVFFGAAAQS